MALYINGNQVTVASSSSTAVGTLAVIGDSISSDQYENNNMAYPRMLKELIGAQTLERATIGGTRIMNYLQTHCNNISNNADIVIVAMGINDISQGYTMGDIDSIMAQNLSAVTTDTIMGTYRKCLETLKNRLTNENAIIVCISPVESLQDTWVGSTYPSSYIATHDELATLRESIRKMCVALGGANSGWFYIDGKDALSWDDHDIHYYDDNTDSPNIHPNMEGEAVYAHYIASHIPPISLIAD